MNLGSGMVGERDCWVGDGAEGVLVSVHMDPVAMAWAGRVTEWR